MKKQVTFSKDEIGDIIATFKLNNKVVSKKNITNTEMDGLEEDVTFDALPATYDAEFLYEALEYQSFDNNGEETNYELMLVDLIKMEEKENE